ncbi:hypothetical protein CCHR01_09123 [Colletotrichum chrysophilum]|uniref:Uncharacterized protein n=1 Tax=Colletotrichum chrysophilum TaxID=1836956 RepID=A0AAD9AHM7_9PEZI|nr:hypothetical protein CCHR01_09123 [Colletotrichum chrysophilum]
MASVYLGRHWYWVFDLPSWRLDKRLDGFHKSSESWATSSRLGARSL